MKTFICGTIAVIMILFNGCSSNGHSDPAPVIRPQQGSELCDEVCEKAKTMTEEDGGVGCMFAEPIPVKEGATTECEPDAGELGCITCTEWCVEQHQNGIYWNTSCIMEAGITQCIEVDTVCNIQ